jgi:archaellum component FlaC
LPIPYFGTAYSLTRLVRETVPELTEEIWSDPEVRQQEEDWGKFEREVAGFSSTMGDFLDEMNTLERTLGRQFIENKEMLTDVASSREFLAHKAELLKTARQNIHKELQALASEYPGVPYEQVDELSKKLKALEKRSETIEKTTQKLIKRQAQLAANGQRISTKIGQKVGQGNPAFAKSAAFSRVSDALSIGFLIYDVAIDNSDDSIRGRNRQRDSLDRSYDTGEGRDLELALARLKGIYNAPCKCPDPPPKEITTTTGGSDTTGGTDTTNTDNHDWRKDHPIWAFILDHVVPEIIHVIIDVIINGDITIENLLSFDENGLPIIVDGIPKLNPNYDGPPIIIDGPGQDTPTFPEGGEWTDFGDIVTTTVEVILFPELEVWIRDQIGDLTQKYPVIGEIFNALGIDSGSIMDTIRNVWGVLTGPGTLGEKLQQLARDAMEGLAKMLGNLIEWGIGKLIDWIGNFVDGLFGSSGSDSATVVKALSGDASPPISEADAKAFAEDMAGAFGDKTFVIKPGKPVPAPSSPAQQQDHKKERKRWDNR